MQVAIELGIEKVVILSPTYKEPLFKTPDLLTALLEEGVIAQGRYQKKDAKTTVCCARMDHDVIGLVDYALAEAKNGDLVLKQEKGYCCEPCYNPNFERDDLTNI